MRSRNLFTNGARLVRRHARLLLWIFVVNVVLAWMASAPVRESFSPLLDHSLASQRLVDRFDLGRWFELLREPAIQTGVLEKTSIHFSIIFLIYMVFINGGVLTVYREDRRLTKAEFFEMSGAFFWRTVRLVLISLIPFAIIGGILSVLSDWSDKLTENATSAYTGFWVLVIGGSILWLATLFVRAWFDLAQSLTVTENDRGMWRNSWRGLVLAFRNIGTLLSTYAGIHLIGIALMVVLCAVVLYIPHRSYRLSILVLEIGVLFQIGVRLWQKAACITWLENRPAVIVAPVYERSEVTAAVPPEAPEQM